MARVRIEDVAARAGVSIATVSKALRGLPVSPSNRERVIEAAQALGWHPDPSASRLASGRKGAIGLVMAYFGLWYDAEVIAGVEAASAASGFDLLIWTTQSLERHSGPLGVLGRVTSRVDGVVLMDFVGSQEQGVLASISVPAVAVGAAFDPFPSYTIDERQAATTATEHLLELGHRRIGLVTGSPTPAGMSPATELRREGFEEALRTRGLRPDRDLEVEGGFTVDGGREAAVALLGLSDPPTAIFCLSDEMAFGVIIAASAAGVAVPEALSVVGFGGHPVARAVNLTTIRQPIVAMTEEAVTGQ